MHCWCCFGSLSVCVCVDGRDTEVSTSYATESTRLDHSESLSHSPRPFCYITNMPFTKKPASCQMTLNQRRSHILTHNFSQDKLLNLTKNNKTKTRPRILTVFWVRKHQNLIVGINRLITISDGCQLEVTHTLRK